jgi:hypothetical protein
MKALITGATALLKETLGQLLLLIWLLVCVAVGATTNSVFLGMVVGGALWVMWGVFYLIRSHKKYSTSRGFRIPPSHD